MKKKYGKSEAIPIIKQLFNEAKTAFKKEPKKANDYVRKARNLAMKHKIKLPSALKRRFCKHCYYYLVPGVNCRIRTHSGKVVYYCLSCKRYMRFPYTRKK